MSSTNRSNARDKHVADYYVTPVKEIQKFINIFGEKKFLDMVILDPCAGGDENNLMSYQEALPKNIKEYKSIDIRDDSLAEIKSNYLEIKLDYEPDIIITNPPFNIAIDIIKKSLNDVREGGMVIMLLRLNFFGSKGRKSFFEEYLPDCCFVHHQRMSFVVGGGTDSIEYMHAVWIKGSTPEYTKLKII